MKNFLILICAWCLACGSVFAQKINADSAASIVRALQEQVKESPSVFPLESYTGGIQSVEDGLRLANASEFGLGGSVWTADAALGESLARRLECGSAFVNSIVKSDPRLPFGGVKASGLGRELSWFGLRAFTNVKGLNLYD